MKPLRYALVALGLTSLAACVTHEREVVRTETPVVRENTVVHEMPAPTVEKQTTIIHEP
jgi:hypothetical protein